MDSYTFSDTIVSMFIDEHETCLYSSYTHTYGVANTHLPIPVEQAQNTIATHFMAGFHVADNVGTERKREAVALRSIGHNMNVTVQIAIATYSRSEIMHSF